MVFNNFFKKPTDAQDKKNQNKEHLDKTCKNNPNQSNDHDSDVKVLERAPRLSRKPKAGPCAI
jgi:hypothetical protein